MSYPWGIDSSSYQPSSQTQYYVTQGIAFGVIKSSEFYSWPNSGHAGHVAVLRASNRLVGHYHFAHSRWSPTIQADFFVRTANPARGDTLWLDIEDGASGNGADTSSTAWHARAAFSAAFINRVNQLTQASCGIYTYPDYMSNMTRYGSPGDLAVLRRAPLWMADIDGSTGYVPTYGWGSWFLHQYSWTGNQDKNVANFADTAALRTGWARIGVGAGTSPTPAPPSPAPPAPQPPAPVPVPVPVIPPKDETMPTSKLQSAWEGSKAIPTNHTTVMPIDKDSKGNPLYSLVGGPAAGMYTVAVSGTGPAGAHVTIRFRGYGPSGSTWVPVFTYGQRTFAVPDSGVFTAESLSQVAPSVLKDRRLRAEIIATAPVEVTKVEAFGQTWKAA